LPPEHFKKLYPIFLDIELNRNKLKVDKWVMEYKYKNNIWIIDVIKVIWIGK